MTVEATQVSCQPPADCQLPPGAAEATAARAATAKILADIIDVDVFGLDEARSERLKAIVGLLGCWISDCCDDGKTTSTRRAAFHLIDLQVRPCIPE